MGASDGRIGASPRQPGSATVELTERWTGAGTGGDASSPELARASSPAVAVPEAPAARASRAPRPETGHILIAPPSPSLSDPPL
jgi:hypothetical protein